MEEPELTEQQKTALRKAIGDIVGDYTPWVLNSGNHATWRNNHGILRKRDRHAFQRVHHHRTVGQRTNPTTQLGCVQRCMVESSKPVQSHAIRHWPRRTIPNERPKAIAGMQNPLMLA